MGKMPGSRGKGKKGKGGDGGKKIKAVTEGLDLNEMTKKQLRTHVKKLFVEIDREREERNFFMLEREKQFLSWNFLLEQIAQEKERARLLEVSYDDAEVEKDREMNIWKQKLRYMMGEQTEKLAKSRLANLYSMKRVQDEIWEIIMILREGTVEKHRQWRAMEASKYAILQMLQQNHSEEIKGLREQFANEVKRMSEQTERKAAEERKGVEVKNENELGTIRGKKEDQIEHMLYMHEKQLLEMKTFFNDLEVNNMAVITSLQQEIALKKTNERRLQGRLKEIQEKYDSLLGPIEEQEGRMVQWAEEETLITKVKKDIENSEIQLKENHHYIRLMSCVNEALLQKSHYIQRERNALRDCFTKSVVKSHMKGTMSRMVGGLRDRGMAMGFQNITNQDIHKGSTVIKKDPICKTLQPFFKKHPFEFNDCIFPSLVGGEGSKCHVLPEKRQFQKVVPCGPNEVGPTPQIPLPPLPSREKGREKESPFEE